MGTLKMFVETKTYAFPGSGEGYGSLIDSDVVFDDRGLPYLPARRIKGILLESAVELQEMLKQADIMGNIANKNLGSIFGKEGQIEASRLMLSDFLLKDHIEIKKWVDWLYVKYPALFSPAVIMDYFTETRQQTSINENGIAEEGSLRRNRVLKKGLIFESEASITEGDIDEKKLLALSCANLRRIGTQRNRGFGEVVSVLYEENTNLTETALSELKGGNLSV